MRVLSAERTRVVKRKFAVIFLFVVAIYSFFTRPHARKLDRINEVGLRVFETEEDLYIFLHSYHPELGDTPDHEMMWGDPDKVYRLLARMDAESLLSPSM